MAIARRSIMASLSRSNALSSRRSAPLREPRAFAASNASARACFRNGQTIRGAKSVQVLSQLAPSPLARTDEDGPVLAVTLHHVFLSGSNDLIKYFRQAVL
jgi:hypothetical protein